MPTAGNTRAEAPSNGPFRLLATILAVLVLLCASLLFWSGDRRLNVPLSRLRPEDVIITTGDFLLSDWVTIAEGYANASLDLLTPSRTTNMTLRLDGPGLVPVNVGSWLPKVWLARKPPGRKNMKEEKTRGLPARYAPDIIDRANVTVTLKMMEMLWPALIHAARDLLILGLGRDHPEYRPLKCTLAEAEPPEPALRSLSQAQELWSGIAFHARDWRMFARRFLDPECMECSAKATSTISPALTIGTGAAPTFQQLRGLAGSHKIAARSLPRVLASLEISPNASAQHRCVCARVFGHPWYGAAGPAPLGLEIKKSELCSTHGLLQIVAGGRCDNGDDLDPELDERGQYIHYDGPGSPSSWTSGFELNMLRKVLCDAEDFLSSLATQAEGVRERVMERVNMAIKERGGISWGETLTSYYAKDGLEIRARTLDRALDAFYALYSSLKLQRQILASMAARMQHVCML